MNLQYDVRSLVSKHWILILSVMLFLALGLARINDLSLYTDSTRYLIWGNSVAHAKGFVDDTQPVPEHYIVNAPFYAAVLASVLLIFPMSLAAAKVCTLLWGALALVLFALLLRRFASPHLVAGAVLFLALNPLMVVISTEVLSEAAFMSFVLLAFIAIERLESGEGKRFDRVFLLLVLSLVTLLREIGIALVAAAVLFGVIRKRYRESIIVFAAAAAVFGLWTLRNTVLVGIPADNQAPNLKFFFGHFVTPPDASLATELLARASINLKGYFGETGGSLFYRFPMNLMVDPGTLFTGVSGIVASFNIVLALLIVGLLLVGLVIDVRTNRTALARLLFLLFYTTIILFYPVHDIRFQLPLLPLVLFYAVRTMEVIRARLAAAQKTVPKWIGGVALVAFILPNLLCCYEITRTNLGYRSDPAGFARSARSKEDAKYFGTPWALMGRLIATHVHEAGVLASSEKEIVPYAPGFRFLEVNRGVPLPMLEGLFRTNSIIYLIAAKSYGHVETFQVSLSVSNRFRLQLIDSVAGLRLYRVIPRLREQMQNDGTQVLTLSTSNAGDLMQLGRLALRSERYPDALRFFSAARDQFARQSEITYYILVAHALAGDSLQAVEELQRLYASPSATSFIPPARVFLYAMNEMKQLRGARHEPGSPDRMFYVARTLWSLGYGRQAYAVARELLSTDSNHFEGLMWAWHWSVQLGDTARSDNYLKRLRSIDSANAVVRSFTSMARLRQKMQNAKGPAELAQLHVSLAKEYQTIDLLEEAFDETERALRADSSSAEAQELLQSLLRKRK